MKLEYQGKSPVSWLSQESLAKATDMEARLHALFIATMLSKLFVKDADCFEVFTADNGHDFVIRVNTIVFDVFGDGVAAFLQCLSNTDHFAVNSLDGGSIKADFTINGFWA